MAPDFLAEALRLEYLSLMTAAVARLSDPPEWATTSDIERATL